MDSIWLKEAMKLEKFRFDEKRQQVRARFHELKKPGKRDAPKYVLCSFDFMISERMGNDVLKKNRPTF